MLFVYRSVFLLPTNFTTYARPTYRNVFFISHFPESLIKLNVFAAISWALYNLARFPEHQRKCQKEVDRILKNKEELGW